MNSATILDLELLQDTDKLNEIDYWLKIMNWDNGWHYDLDIIWLLKNIEEMKLPEGSTIIDAGAGLGIMQFILAARGYNVISLDFADRNIPENIKQLFNIEYSEKNFKDNNPYRNFIKYDKSKKIKREASLLKIGSFWIKKKFASVKSSQMTKKHLQNKGKSKGTITFLKASFNEIPLKSNTVDLIVSVSAIEHNKIDLNQDALTEFKRVIKEEAKILITTNTTTEKESWFHKESLGWCFSKNDVKGIFGADLEGDYLSVKNEMINSPLFNDRISMAYKISSRNGLPFGDIKSLKYLPIGISINK